MTTTVKELIKQLEGINPNAEVHLYIPYDIEEDHRRDFVSEEFEIIKSFLEYDTPFIEIFSLKDIQNEEWVKYLDGDKKLLEDIQDTLEHIVDSEEWETLKETSSADILIEKLKELL